MTTHHEMTSKIKLTKNKMTVKLKLTENKITSKIKVSEYKKNSENESNFRHNNKKDFEQIKTMKILENKITDRTVLTGNKIICKTKITRKTTTLKTTGNKITYGTKRKGQRGQKRENKIPYKTTYINLVPKKQDY